MIRPLPILIFATACGAPATDTTGSGSPSGSPTGSPTTETTLTPPECNPPALQVLADIPDRPSLGDGGDVVAAFEVDGDTLVAKYVNDSAIAEGALALWQEVVLRIPLNQRAQLVQFTLFQNPGLAGYVDNVGTGNQVGRYGPALYLNQSNVADNDPDVCAPLSGHRGTFDWTLIHEFGHLRQYADGTVDDFVEGFGNETGEGLGYPEDGSPRLDGDWVSSYAERAGGDEDAAESFTAFVMLADLPTEASGAGDKVRFFDDQPDYAALRQALRVTEPGGGNPSVPAAPLLAFDLEIDNPDWLLGTWEGAGPNGPVQYVMEPDNTTFRQTIGQNVEEVSYKNLRDDGTLATLRVVESSEDFHLVQAAIGSEGYSETFSLQGATVLVEREHLGTFTVARVGP